MALSLKPEHLKRYKDVVRLLWKYGRRDIVQGGALDGAVVVEPPEEAEDPSELADDLEDLGPTWIKLGQLLSTRADLLPLTYLEALSRLQDEVEPFGYEAVEEIVERELGVRISKAFDLFEAEPIAAASLGQVHRAVLRDGEQVAVKVQRPGIRGQIEEDLEAFAEIAELLDAHTEYGRTFGFRELVDEFRTTLFEELDYRREASNLQVLRENLEEFDRIEVPRPVEDYTTERVLTMEFIHGTKVTALSPLRRLEVDGEALADTLFEAYLQQILVDGFCHADPHPGNVFLTEDDRLALIDLGMTARIAKKMREKLLKLVLAIGEGRGEEAAAAAEALGDPVDGLYDRRGLRRTVVNLVGRYEDAAIRDIEVGRVVMEISRAAANNGIRAPTELTLLGKTLLNLDAVGRTLAPEFDPNAAIRRHAGELTSERMWQDASPASVMSSMLETAEFVKELPGRVNRILDQLASNELTINVDSMDESTMIDGFQKVANRITTGLVLAALIVGAAMLMRVETEFTVFGYPGLAMLCFLAAAVMGFALVLDILLNDWKNRRPRR
ncbi:MAG: AarF/UbiB family protein [Gemmatimonadota bacterium]|nr:AarF/UbiB family protein [Gemmatimonadota bacterium]